MKQLFEFFKIPRNKIDHLQLFRNLGIGMGVVFADRHYVYILLENHGAIHYQT
jgi:hypothetical protein